MLLSCQSLGSGLCSLLWPPSRGCILPGSDPGSPNRALGDHASDPDILWPWASGQQHPPLGPVCRDPEGGSEDPAQPCTAPTTALHSRVCCVSLGGSRDLSRPTSASLTHLHDLPARAGLPDLLSYHCPIGLGKHPTGSHFRALTLAVPSAWHALPRSWSLPVFLSQSKDHLLRRAFPDGSRRREVSPALLYLHSLGGLGAWEGTSPLCRAQSLTS